MLRATKRVEKPAVEPLDVHVFSLDDARVKLIEGIVKMRPAPAAHRRDHNADEKGGHVSPAISNTAREPIRSNSSHLHQMQDECESPSAVMFSTCQSGI